MSLQERLTEEMKTAMKAKDSLRLNTIRGIRTAIKNQEIATGGKLDDEAVIAILSTLAKQRREATTAFREGGREELATKEEAELVILQDFLPAQLDEAELQKLIGNIITELGAESMKDMGRVMQAATAKTKGRADGKVVSQIVKKALAG